MKQGKLICIIGLDGSGKTTQAKLLVKYLNSKKKRTKYVWNRFEPKISYPLVYMGRKIFLRKADPYREYKKYALTKKKLFRNSILFNLYEKVILTDYFLQIFIKITFPLYMGINIVSDRYIYDSIVDIASEGDFSKDEIYKLFKRYSSIVPNPDVIIYIDINEEEAYRRKDDIPSIKYLKIRKKYYLELMKILKENGYRVYEINGEEDIESIQNKIQNYIREVFTDA